MNTMMNFMPLMVIFFGWSFISGAVLYWAIQSVYSVVQQWLITGWGQMKDWFPRLPDMPEHRRLGYVAPRNLDDVVVLSGEAPAPKGVMGWMQKRMAEAEKQQAARHGTASGGSGRAGAEPATAGATGGGAGGAGARANGNGNGTGSGRSGNGARNGKNARRGPTAAGKSASARASATATADTGDVIDVDASDETDAAPTPTKRDRRGTSYQDRVNAATARKTGGK